ncbi:MAG: carbohydrate ABC transporter permease [Micrococcales bacterium]|nr:carbohydrate ABC transporter permease [Micrococcales bacterium]
MAITTGLETRQQQDKLVGKGFDWGRLVRYALLIGFCCLVLMPAYVMVITSFKSNPNPAHAWNPVDAWTLESWKTAFTGTVARPGVAAPMLRTVMMVVPAAIISSFLGSMNGFVLSRWRFPGANIVFALLLFGMFIPYQAVIIPLYGMVINLRGMVGDLPMLTQTILTLIMLHVVYGIPITTLIFRNYYQSVPTELIEAARVDGAGMIRTYIRVVLPISMPSFVVVLIWQFTSAWNDFLFALYFSPSPEYAPVTVTLNTLASPGGGTLSDYGVSMAAAIMASLPTLLVYVLLGKYFIGGLMSGSVKG